MFKESQFMAISGKTESFRTSTSNFCTSLEFQLLRAETGLNCDAFDVYLPRILPAPSGKCEENASVTAKTAVHSD